MVLATTYAATLKELRALQCDDSAKTAEINEAFTEVDKSLAALLNELQELQASAATEKARLEANAAVAPKTIKLNVGGRVFETSKDNLLRDADSFFYAMVTSETWQPRARDGAYFIDGNYTYFDRVMAYLRTGHLDADGLSESARSQLLFTLRALAMESILPTAPPSTGACGAAPAFGFGAQSGFGGSPFGGAQATGFAGPAFGSASASAFGAARPVSASSNDRATTVPVAASTTTLAAMFQRIRRAEEDRQKGMKKVTDDYERSAAAIEAEIAALRTAQNRRNTIQKLTQAQAAIADDTIRLNVGGTLFETSRATLLALRSGAAFCKQPDTFFQAMLSQGHWTPRDDDGAYFIDQDARYFEYALDMLRQGTLNTKGLSATAQKELHRLLDFLQMKSSS